MNHIWVTRDEIDDGPLCTALRAHQLEPILEPVVRREVLASGKHQLHAIRPGDWLILTSPFAIEAVLDLPNVPEANLAVVGTASEQRAKELGLKVGFRGPDGTGESLRNLITSKIHSGTVWYLRSDQATALANWADVTLHDVVLYSTRRRDYNPAIQSRVSLISLTSPSAVEAIEDIQRPVASIGPTTTAALLERNISPVTVPDTPSLNGLASAIAEWCQRADSNP